MPLSTQQDDNAPTEELARALINAMPAAALWQFFSDRDAARGARLSTRDSATRGFKSGVRALSHGLVKARLAKHLRETPDEFFALLNEWSRTSREAIEGARNGDSEEKMTARFGADNVQVARYLLDAAPHLAPEETPPSPALSTQEIGAETTPSTATVSSSAEKEVTALQRRLDIVKAARDRYRAQSQELSSQNAQLKTDLQRARDEMSTQLAGLRRDEKTAREMASASQKTQSRAERKQRAAEDKSRALDEENARLKRQIRQLQQTLEDARKTAMTSAEEARAAHQSLRELQSRLAQNQSDAAPPLSAQQRVKIAKVAIPKAARVQPETKQIAAKTPRLLDPLDRVFRWENEGRAFAVTLRETRLAIATNDEEKVFTLARALENLRESDALLHREFLAGVREFGAYFRRVLTAPTTRVLVDASNVARIETDRRGRGKLDFLLQARDELRLRDAFPLVLVADASLQHFIDEPAEIAAMARRGELLLLPAGNIADDYLAREARRSGAFVLTNDKSFHKQVAPDWEPSRIGFRLRHHFLEIDEF